MRSLLPFPNTRTVRLRHINGVAVTGVEFRQADAAAVKEFDNGDVSQALEVVERDLFRGSIRGRGLSQMKSLFFG